MAVTAKYYGKFIQSLLAGEIDLDTATVKVMICNASYVPDQDTHRYKSDVTNEVTGAGYTAGGATVGAVTTSYDSGSNVTSFDGADVAISTVTFSNGRYAVLYVSTGSDATSPLIGYIDFGENKSLSAGNLAIVWDALGIGAVAVA